MTELFRHGRIRTTRAKAELVRRYGTALIVAGATYRAFPSPAELAGATLDELTEAVGNGRKAAYLLGLARAFGEMPEAFLRHGPYEEVAGWLRGLRGIGEWSASFVLIRGLGRMDRGLIDDPQGRFTQHMLEAARRVYGAGVTFERLQELAAHYGPWQGYWAHYLRAAA